MLIQASTLIKFFKLICTNRWNLRTQIQCLAPHPAGLSGKSTRLVSWHPGTACSASPADRKSRDWIPKQYHSPIKRFSHGGHTYIWLLQFCSPQAGNYLVFKKHKPPSPWALDPPGQPANCLQPAPFNSAHSNALQTYACVFNLTSFQKIIEKTLLELVAEIDHKGK